MSTENEIYFNALHQALDGVSGINNEAPATALTRNQVADDRKIDYQVAGNLLERAVKEGALKKGRAIRRCSDGRMRTQIVYWSDGN